MFFLLFLCFPDDVCNWTYDKIAWFCERSWSLESDVGLNLALPVVSFVITSVYAPLSFFFCKMRITNPPQNHCIKCTVLIQNCVKCIQCLIQNIINP